MRWIRYNWPYKLIALVSAITLWAYVHQEDAAPQRIIEDTVALRNVPRGMLALLNARVSVTVTGPADQLAAFSSDDVDLWIDLRDVNRSGTYNRRIYYALRRNPGMFAVHTYPESVNVQLVEQNNATMIVKAVITGAPPFGYVFSRPSVNPPDVVMSGFSKDIALVRQAVASVAANGTAIDEYVRVLALDARGDPVTTVKIAPDSVRIVADLRPEPSNREAPVDPVLSGRPADGYKVIGWIVDPRSVVVRGEKSQINRLNGIQTRNVDVSGLDSDRVVVVATARIPGVEIIPDHVKVTIKIAPLQRTR